MKHNIDNCIPFDEISSLYDETRFFPQDRVIITFDKIIEIFLKRINEKKATLHILDAGTGSGRLLLPFIKQLIQYIKENNINSFNTFEFDCIDVSNPMLKLFEKKLLDNSFKILSDSKWEYEINSTKIRVKLIEDDLRMFQIKKTEYSYDIVFAHWIFHTIRDWQLALLNILLLSKENSLLFTFEETSDLYFAIDNNLGNLSSQNQKEFWEKYFYYRKKIYNYFGLIPQLAKDRIGSHVQDEKIIDWIEKIYGKQNNELKKDIWEKKYTYNFIINDIIGKQLFSNMKLPYYQNINPYKEISKSLYQYYFNNEKEHLTKEFISTTTFGGKFFVLHNKLNSKLLIEIFKDAINRKSPEDLFSIPNRAYKIFFNLFWRKINDDFIEGVAANNIKAIVGVHFFDKKNDNNIQVNEDFLIEKDTAVLSNYKKIWLKINSTNESDTPFLINFEETSSSSIKEISLKNIVSHSTSLRKIDDEIALVEYINENSELKKIKDFAINNKLTQPLNSAIKDFFVGLLEINISHNEDNDLNNFYFFPNQFITPSGDNKNFGLLIVTNEKLLKKTVSKIQNFSLLLFSTLSSDLKLDLSINLPIVVTKYHTRNSPKIMTSRSKEQCSDVLIVTAFGTEFEQALKLSGVKKNQKESRNLRFPNHYNSKKLPQIYDISSSDFKNKRVWLFQIFETGNGEFGVEYTLENVLSFLKYKYSTLPKYILMGGVTAGMQEDKQLKGQLLVAESFWNIDDFSNINELSNENKIICNLEKFKINEVKNLYIKKIEKENLHLTHYRQEINIGAFITVKDVLDDYPTRQAVKDKVKLLNDDKDVLGLEMEGYGFAKVCKKFNADFLFCKGISDFAHKKDEITDVQKNVAKNNFDFIFYLIEKLE